MFRQSCLGLVLFPSIFPQSRLGLVLIWMCSFKNNKAKIQSFYSLKDGSRLGLVNKDTETLGLVLVLPEILSQVKSWSRLVHKKNETVLLKYIVMTISSV